MAILALVASGLVVGLAPSASATQASGDDVAAWSNGWSWTYATVFHYVDSTSDTDASINENVTYTVAGSTTFGGQDAYQLNITGNITGGSGHTVIEGTGTVNLSGFSGSVSGTRIVRKSDLALLQENQAQTLAGSAKYSIFTIGVNANINLQLTPSPGWRSRDFPLNAGDSWQNNESLAYTGGFSYTSSLANGSSPFDGAFDFDGPSTVANQTISVGAGSLSTKAISAQSNTPDGLAVDNIWWSADRKNDAQEHLQLPLDSATLTIDRSLSSSSTPAPSTSLTATATPSLTCAGGQVTVAGKLGNASGVPVSIYLDKSQISAGQQVTANTVTGTNGAYAATLTAPAESDGLAKNGSRGNWGIYVSGGGVNAATTLVVTPKDCTTLEYTGATTAPRATNASVSAKLTNLAGSSVNGRTVTFSLDGGASVDATTNSSGIATANLPVGDTARTTTVRAHYAGSATSEAADTSTAFVVGKVGTVTSVSPSVPSVEINDPVTFTADVTTTQSGVGTPDGSVQFTIDGTNFGAAVSVASGSATSAAFSTSSIGNHTVQAIYSGSAGFSSSTSTDSTFAVTPSRAPTTTTASAAPSSSVFGQSVTLSATVTPNGGGATPTGSVTFKRGATVIGSADLDGDGKVTLATDALPVGTIAVVATYSGDDTYRSSASSPQSVVVSKAAVSVDLQSSKSPTVTGEGVDFTASVSPVAPGAGLPSGSVQLQVDGADVGAPVALTGGVATFDAVTSLHAGGHTVKAVYSGSSSFEGDTDSISQDVNKADTTTTAITSPEVSNENSPFTITATVVANAPGSGTPTGNVTFSADGSDIGASSLGTDGQASISVDNLPPGDHAITVSYVGSSDYGDSASESVNHSVIEGAAVVPTSLDLSSSENPTTYGRLISFSAQVNAENGSTPAGTVQFSVDGTNIGDPVTVGGDGIATSALLAAPEPGDHTVIAAFQADAGYAGSGAIITQTVTDAGVVLDLGSSDANSDYGQSVHFTTHVASAQAGTATPTGFVQFRVDGADLGDAVEVHDGAAVSPAVSDLAPGDHQVTAVYSGDAHFVSDQTTLTQKVAKIGTTTSLVVSPTTSMYGDPLDLTATVAPSQNGLSAPTGSVDFMDGSTTLATVPLAASGGNGTAHVVLHDLGAGAHSIKAVYAGTANFAGSNSALKAISIAKRATSVKAEPAVVKVLPLGLPLGRLQVKVSSSLGPLVGVPVTFTIGSKTVGTSTTDVNGVASVNASSQLVQLILAGGYTATFNGTSNFEGSSAHGAILQ
ncbi:MAG: hypothetical protein JWQ70_510 [Aeromicrobium sp.]|nr:hypothetical protein [Aeromicrobium sp.]